MARLVILLWFIISSMIVHATDDCAGDDLSINGECRPQTLDALDPGWNKVEPGGETICAHGSPYAYWVRPGRSNDLLIYFEGGGGCWNEETCRDTGRKFNGFYDNSVTDQDSPERSQGILNLSHPENPFADYTTLFIPVCTGDVHWGDNVMAYSEDVVMHFNGFVNASAALNWAYSAVPAPNSIFVTGCSAGSPGSIIHAPYIIEQYPNAQLTQIGDSLTLLFDRPVDLQTDWHAHDNFAQWIPDLAEMEPREWIMAKLYIATAAYYPNTTFGQFNSVRDRVQVFYTWPDGSGDPYAWTELLDNHLTTIESQVENYVSFTSGGDVHCITPRNDFYRYAIDGVKLRDWFADLANGEPVESLHCEDCEEPERASN